MNDIEESLLFAKQVANRAGQVMLQYFDTQMEQKIKEDEQLVTIADEKINQLVINEVAKEYPNHSVFGEEATVKKDSEFTWVCDPIDGTIPFSRGIPLSVFSLALVRDGEPIVGVAYDPFTKRLYSAAKNTGAYLNEKPIRVSNNKLRRHSIVNVEWWPDAEFDVQKPMHQLSLDTNTYLVNLSCVINACCLVANGKYEASIYTGSLGKNVDMAAVKIIVEEAGGKVTDLFGNNQRYDQDIKGAIVSNKIVHRTIIDYLEKSKSLLASI